MVDIATMFPLSCQGPPQVASRYMQTWLHTRASLVRGVMKIQGLTKGLTEKGSAEGWLYAGRSAQGEGSALLDFCLSSLFPRSASPKPRTCLATLLSLLPVLCGSPGQRLES